MPQLPPPPYYAVIFSSKRNTVDDGYYALNTHLMGVANDHPGYLGIESYREADGRGISIVYFDSLESIQAWRSNPQHTAAKAQHEKWYDSHRVQISRVERAYGWERTE